MMNCKELEMIMADALGGELSDADRPTFEQHIAQCQKCRREYESAQQTIRTLQSLTGPARVSVQRVGDRLIIRESSTVVSPRWKPSMSGMLRYAAGVLIAFTAGYGLHAGLMMKGADSYPAYKRASNGSEIHRVHEDFQSALAGVHARYPSRSDLAKCMIAMFSTNH